MDNQVAPIIGINKYIKNNTQHKYGVQATFVDITDQNNKILMSLCNERHLWSVSIYPKFYDFRELMLLVAEASLDIDQTYHKQYRIDPTSLTIIKQTIVEKYEEV